MRRSECSDRRKQDIPILRTIKEEVKSKAERRTVMTKTVEQEVEGY
jgi:hypothetical protein